MTRPCPDCPPETCHRTNGLLGHVATHGFRHDGSTFTYCRHCLTAIKFINDRWEADIILKEWA